MLPAPCQSRRPRSAGKPRRQGPYRPPPEETWRRPPSARNTAAVVPDSVRSPDRTAVAAAGQASPPALLQKCLGRTGSRQGCPWDAYVSSEKEKLGATTESRWSASLRRPLASIISL